MGTVISLLRSSFKSCPILDRCLRLSQFYESLSASDKTKSYLSWDCVMLEFAQMSEIRDFSLCILRVHNLSDHERECGVVLRHHCVSFNILALDSLFRVSWEGSPLDSGTLCNLCTFHCCRNTAKRKRSMRCVWKASTLRFHSFSLSLSGRWPCFPGDLRPRLWSQFFSLPIATSKRSPSAELKGCLPWRQLAAGGRGEQAGEDWRRGGGGAQSRLEASCRRRRRAGRRRLTEGRRGRLDEVDGWWNGTENESFRLTFSSIKLNLM